MIWIGIAIGFYLGIGGGCVLWALAEVGFRGGYRLLWRVPTVILFWPSGIVLAFIYG